MNTRKPTPRKKLAIEDFFERSHTATGVMRRVETKKLRILNLLRKGRLGTASERESKEE